MAEIERIGIKGSSGYCCVDEAFKDKVTIKKQLVPECEYTPVVF